jgi:hypothetical protein
MAIALVVTLAASFGGPSGGTTSAIDTTGANLIVISVSYYSAASGFPVVSDSKSNTWTALTARENVSGHRFYYCLSPTVGTGHTFTIVRGSIADIYPAVVVHAFSGVNLYEAQSGTTTGGVASTSIQPGSLTPSVAGALVLTGMAFNVISGVAVDSGLTLTEQPDINGVCVTGATGWKVQSPAAAINPTWSWTSAQEGGVNLVVFTPAAAPLTGARVELFIWMPV